MYTVKETDRYCLKKPENATTISMATNKYRKNKNTRSKDLIPKKKHSRLKVATLQEAIEERLILLLQ